MKTRAVRIYGEKDLRLESFDLPPISYDEIRAKIITDSICMSTYKLVQMGQKHSRAPENMHENPPIIGHEYCGTILEVGDKWKHKYSAGQNFIMQTAMMFENSMHSPGFSLPYLGGNSTYVNIPNIVMEKEFLVPYNSDTFYFGSLAEPMACIAAAFHANYHIDPNTFAHTMEIKKGGKVALMASAGPMGLGAIDYAVNNPQEPSLVVVTDIDEKRLSRAEALFSEIRSRKPDLELKFVNTSLMNDPVAELKRISGGGFDDVFVMAPVEAVITQADQILAKDGCLNFFAGPTDKNLSARVNFYNIHYAATHVAGTTGSRIDDMREVVELMNKGVLNPTAMITHIGGMNSVIDTVLHLPEIPGGKKMIYVQIDFPLTAIDDFEKLGENDPLFADLARITKKHNGLWSDEAEKYLLRSITMI
jgi:threonine dehydrogenase-like Zn-dependent dehydrogenase